MGSKQFCTFYLEDLFFGIDVLKVQEVLRFQEMTQVPHAPPVVRGLINLRGQIVTALDLRRRLQMPDGPLGEETMNVIVKDRDAAVSLLVDRIGDVLEVEDDCFDRPPHNLDPLVRQLLDGVYKLEEGLLLILDTDKAADLEQPASAAESPLRSRRGRPH